MIIGGIDEAGRGPVIGPLVISAVSFKENKIKELERLGVKDSKKLNPQKRRNLEVKIKDLSTDYQIKEIKPEKIDNIRSKSNLNQFEANLFLKLLKNLKADTLYSDWIDRNFKKKLSNNFDKDITVKRKADELFLPVSAASILAKVKRDQTVNKINSKNPDAPAIGSGYPSDEKTQKFLKWWYEENNNFPNFARKSWKTLDKIRTEVETQRLDDL